MPYMLSGRSISRAPEKNQFTTEYEAGKETLANLSLIAKFAPKPLQEKIHSHIKEWINVTGEAYNFYNNPRDFEALTDLKDIINDSSVIAEEEKPTLNLYASMDRVFQKTNDYAVGISMYSNRIGNYEFGNTENKH